jgi:hypothetical protein
MEYNETTTYLLTHGREFRVIAPNEILEHDWSDPIVP